VSLPKPIRWCQCGCGTVLPETLRAHAIYLNDAHSKRARREGHRGGDPTEVFLFRAGQHRRRRNPDRGRTTAERLRANALKARRGPDGRFA
jgi:hypothetical protein